VSLAELQKDVSQWAERTFGPVGSNASVAARANKEMSELLMTLATNDTNPKAAEEAADVLLVLLRLADRMGFDIVREAEKKMVVNHGRKWKLDGNGHGYHVEGKQ
jgi:NTP pyrophosphatase (non-canonical NTP hydrolase)